MMTERDAWDEIIAEKQECERVALNDFVYNCEFARLGESHPELVYCECYGDFLEWEDKCGHCHDCAEDAGVFDWGRHPYSY